MPFTVTITNDSASPAIAALVRSTRTLRPFYLRWGQASSQLMARRARAKGGRHLFREIARSIHVASASDAGAVVAVDHVAGAARQFGAAISAPGRGPGASGAQRLLIPFKGTPGYGRRASEFANLEWSWRHLPDGRLMGLLGVFRGRGPRGGKTRFQAYFLMMDRGYVVDHPASPWMPTPAELLALGEREALIYLGSALRG